LIAKFVGRLIDTLLSYKKLSHKPPLYFYYTTGSFKLIAFFFAKSWLQEIDNYSKCYMSDELDKRQIFDP